MQYQIGTTYQIITSIVGIVGGILIIVYRKKILELQKKHFSKQKDLFSRKALENLEKRSEVYNTFLTVTVGLFIFILAVIQLLKLL